MREPTALRVRGLVSGYAEVKVIRDLSATISAGKVTVLVGHNGAGKTTLAKTLIGTIRSQHGEILLGDRDLTGLSVRERIRCGLALVLQEAAVFPTLSVTENLEFVRRRVPKGSTAATLATVWDAYPALAQARHRMAAALSGGQQRMLAIAMGVLLNPSLLILDEPSLGLSPLIVHEVMVRTRAITQQTGAGVLLIEQNIDAAMRVADDVLAMRNGDMVFAGPRSALKTPADMMSLL